MVWMRRTRMTTLLGTGLLVVVVTLSVALWPQSVSDGGDSVGGLRGADAGLSVSAGALLVARTRAHLPPCSAPVTTAPVERRESVLADVVLPCLGDGAPIDIGRLAAGTPVVVNYWAFWCVPCRTELPVMADYAAQAGPRVRVITVHGTDGAQRPDLALNLLADVGVHLPTLVDSAGRFAAAAKLPRVYPATVFVRADGSIAAVAPRVFHSPSEIAESVSTYLGA